jgi:hypothetical protein
MSVDRRVLPGKPEPGADLPTALVGAVPCSAVAPSLSVCALKTGVLANLLSARLAAAAMIAAVVCQQALLLCVGIYSSKKTVQRGRAHGRYLAWCRR